ncbi:MAG: hypothetical protein RJA34_2607 [Pseudomonadota bacterium]
MILPGLIYADVRIRVSAGGTGKTTVALFEAITLALGNELWGQKPPAPIKTVMVTHEDSREILVARMRIILNEMFLNSEEIDQVLNNVQILDVSGTGYRLSRIDEDVVQPHFENIDAMVEACQLFQPDWIIFDPLVSFGVGESRVNDAEQGLIEAFRVFRNKLDCCIEGIHHTGKANAREKTSDQYSGRGGSALADGSRMVVVMLPVEAQEWFQKTGISLEEDESGLVMHFAKLSYCKRPASIYIRRSGFTFTQESISELSTADLQRRNMDQVFEFISSEFSKGKRYNNTQLDQVTPQLNLTRKELRECLDELCMEGSIVYRGKRGKVGSFYEPKEPDCGIKSFDSDKADGTYDW